MQGLIVRKVLQASLNKRHRLVLSYEAQMDEVAADTLVDELLEAIPEVVDA